MVEKYNPTEIEPRWREKWAETGLYRTVEDRSKPKWYFLTMLPYTSGNLHIGHWYAMSPSDTKARYYRMNGYNAFFPIGFDAFGLPAENAAIRHGIHPYQWTHSNIENMRRQLRTMGAMWAWDREAVSCEPEYYKWNQWFFLQFYKHGLAYRKMSPVDWCPTCNTTLAREQVWGEDRHCERCHTPVVKRDLAQWFWKITDYADELLDFSKIDWPEPVRIMQTNWIGRSEGAEFTLGVRGTEDRIPVFTTRPDTVYGMTFAVLAPEHPLVDKLTTPEHRDEVEAYKLKASRQSEIERLSTEKERDGVFIGAYAVNPLNNEEIPIYIADYVLMTYGTGAIMAVPAHDGRDFDFATRYGLPIPVVIAPPDWDGQPLTEAYTGPGTMVNSGPFDGRPSNEGWHDIVRYMEEHDIGLGTINYRLHDWLISRQRYWGTPIPIIYCPDCGTVPVPEEDLPVLLPEDAEFRPTGESPLRFHEGFLRTVCPQCGGPAERETDTMDTFVDSSWYQYRYMSPDYDEGPFDPKVGKYWLPVDQYTGGIEHATMHLLYTRFFTKAMRDIGLVDFDEPMIRLFNQGIILGEDSEKMSKSRGNVVDPDDLVSVYGADTFRAYLMFVGPWSEGGPWNSQGIEGVYRFLAKVWDIVLETATKINETDESPSEKEIRALQRTTHQTIRKVTQDMEAFKFNTMLAALMKMTNYLMQARRTAVANHPAWQEAIRSLVLMLAPPCPHIAEELWERLGGPYSVHQQAWPTWNEDLAREEVITLVLQINGKLRDRVEVPVDITAEEARALALASEKIQRHLQDRDPRKVVFVPGRLVNIVV
ncbi:MAG: leucine--tRNA ligase [Chloroflexi bacterium]|nr:leucine--tRNA ligase [Chloroflexota bacterium]